MKSILEQLSSMTVVVADTGDLDSNKKIPTKGRHHQSIANTCCC